jgi:CRISPR/Cas system-associated exonuclease Cas4 (RecB family)
MVDDAPVWLRVDFAARAGSRVMLYDWKTGEPGEDDLFQLTVYALYMRQVAGVDVERLRVAGVYLQRRDVHSVVITDRMLESAQERIRSSVGEMRSCLEDEGENRAVPERFPMTDQERVCAACVFKEVCHPRDWRDLGG